MATFRAVPQMPEAGEGSLRTVRPNDRRTVPHPVEPRPIHTLRVDVSTGPDRGRSVTVDHDRISVGTADDNELSLSDETVSRYHLDLRRAPNGVEVEDHGSTNGTWVGDVRIHKAVVAPGTTLELGRTQLRLVDGEIRRRAPPPERKAFHGLIGETPDMRQLMANIERIGPTEASVLLLGETGTGKEVIARALHLESRRRQRPFEIIDCGALLPTLIASELFGHEKGAFTGANARHSGAFERATGGTIFLDEIGELPLNLQIQLLGVLERRAFRRVGGSEYLDADVRIVSATHRDLRRWVNTGEFRHDLYYRLAVVRLEVPALRDRSDDIPLLAEHFLERLGNKGGIADFFPGSALDLMKKYYWPGNVRELRNYVEAAVAFGEAPPVADEEASLEDPGPEHDSLRPYAHVYPMTYSRAREEILAEFQRAYFRALLKRAHGNVSQAARLAEMNRPHLVTLLQKLGLR